MGQGTSTPPPATQATPGAGQTGQGMTPQQIQAVAALLGQMGKRPQAAGIQATTTRTQPQTNTLQGGAYFNPNRQ
jgi:hypothetical protein